mmetsp:Transcript_3037/g.7819  ORF Transcript_3037/g.7819 Transcript_3037/m.7819 type:complete len:268 (+) Transcript_3037:185-988(+)
MCRSSARCFVLLIVLRPALGAFPSSLPIDRASLDALVAGEDVCGDANHRDSCLRVADCAELDPFVACTAADPVWLPDGAQGGNGGREVLFRRVLPVPATPHPNAGSLQKSKSRLVGSPAYQQLPSAVALYDTSAATKAHAEHCTARYCVIPAALYLVHEAEVSFPSSKIKGFSGMYDVGRDVVVGLRRSDILFSWLGLDSLVGELPPLRRALGERPILRASIWAAVMQAVRTAAEPASVSRMPVRATRDGVGCAACGGTAPVIDAAS